MATHLRAGEITATRVSCLDRTYLIKVTVYIDTESGVHFGGPGELLFFGDSTWVEVPDTPTTPRPDLGLNMGMATFSVLHTYAGPGRYLIRYSEPYRNGGVVNIANPLSTLFYIETSIEINPFVGCDNSPQLLVPPIDKACVGSAWYHNPGAYDIDGDSLSYQLIVPKMGLGQSVVNYRDPNSPEFYLAGQYPIGNEDQSGRPEFSINPTTGTIIWNAPGMQGEYNIAFLIKEWRKVNGRYVLLGYVERDMQILVEDCNNQRPELTVPQDVCVEAGTKITEDIFGFDPDADSVMIEAFSQALIVNPSPARISPSPRWLPSSPSAPARVSFDWQTDCQHVRREPYQVTFKITDRPRKGGVRLTQFKTWNITVVGPAPKWESATVNPGTRQASLSWTPYACQNATTIQVWRRVDQFPYEPPACVTGIPAFLGYSLVSELPIGQTTFLDTNGGKGLAPGASYCYRLLAIYPQPNGGESYVSQEICVDPILADRPVITNVTVDETDMTNGVITVQWTPPFDADVVQFPPPYTYEVFRSQGINGRIGMVKPHPGRLTSVTYQDRGINTDQQIHNYRIVAFDANNQRIDTSFAASSVRLELRPQVNRIELTWAADVPWSNKTDQFPLHSIFRGDEDVADSQLQLIGEVNVNANGFRFVDDGTRTGFSLAKDKQYCYRVLTRGAYGNPKIEEPLLNYSQRICATLNDETPPCAPTLAVDLIGSACEDPNKAGCGVQSYSNTLRWNRPTNTCGNDVASYSIFVADQAGDEFIEYATNVRDTFFVDRNENLKSFARCYKVMAIDRSGNKSELSEAFCFDNCPHYELPNVFTPNGDGCNDVFAAYGDPDQPALCERDDDPSKCARFVLHVDFVVYDRWGKKIYELVNSKERSIYIRWNGHDNQGREVPAGVYFYRADVQFLTSDPSQEFQEIKGWVHLVRGKAGE